VQLTAARGRWADGTLRPVVEGLWGAGAVAHHLARHTAMRPSPEAGAALAAWHAVHQVVPERLTACLSGIELARMGFPGDIEVAAEVDTSASVPVLVDGLFRGTTP